MKWKEVVFKVYIFKRKNLQKNPLFYWCFFNCGRSHLVGVPSANSFIIVSQSDLGIFINMRKSNCGNITILCCHYCIFVCGYNVQWLCSSYSSHTRYWSKSNCLTVKIIFYHDLFFSNKSAQPLFKYESNTLMLKLQKVIFVVHIIHPNFTE